MCCVLVHRHNLANGTGGGGLTMAIRNFYLQSWQTQGFHSFHSSHHLNNCLENISIFCMSLFKSVAKKKNF